MNQKHASSLAMELFENTSLREGEEDHNVEIKSDKRAWGIRKM